MAASEVKAIEVSEIEAKSPLFSKTIHFNILSALLVPAVWPFLPKWFTSRPGSVDAISAYFAIGNIVLRFLTRKIISFKWRKFWTATTENTSVTVATTNPAAPVPATSSGSSSQPSSSSSSSI